MGKLGRARQSHYDDEGHDQTEKKNDDQIVHGGSVARLFGKCAGEQDEPHSDPERENARDPETDEDAVVAVEEKPEDDAGKKTDERRQQKWIINFGKHIV